MADWSLATPTPNFVNSATAGYQAGQALGRQKLLDSALGGIDLDRPETLLPVLRADPATGAALIGASVKLSSEKRQLAQQQAIAGFVRQAVGAAGTGGGGGGTPTSNASAPGATATPLPTQPDGTSTTGSDVVVTGQRPQATPDLSTSVAGLVANGGSLSDAKDLVSLVGSLNENQQKQADDAASAEATLGIQALKLPYEQRKAFIQSNASYLLQHHLSQAQIDAVDPTDDFLHTQVTKALGIKGAIAQANSDRDFGLSQQRTAEQQRHDQVDEGQGERRIGLEGANVGIARAHLALDQQKAAASASGATPAALPAPTNAASYAAIPRGGRYRAPDGTVRVKS